MIIIRQAIPRMPEFRFQQPVDWTLLPGQHWAVVGPNGAGKTLLTGILTGKIPLKEGTVDYEPEHGVPVTVRTLSFKDIYDVADYKNMYYQQRWNASENDASPLVRDLIAADGRQEYAKQLLTYFNAEDLPDKRFMLLSSGELRKLLIIRALLSKPSALILDNPYIGLDALSRLHLNELLEQISRMEGFQIILVLSDPGDIPAFITHVLPVSGMKTGAPLPAKELKNHPDDFDRFFPLDAGHKPLPQPGGEPIFYQYALQMEAVNIRYGNRIILKDFHWQVARGEKWTLQGPNGAGKSTLLSLVCADNPQSYANTFYLFDRKRGSGESIWDIKKRIGYVSPEIHLYYREDVSAKEVVGSGFFDSIGLYRKCDELQYIRAAEWMDVFGIGHLQDRSFLKMSYGEQRLVLLARAFVKHPELLILDEPLHGLDKANKLKVTDIISRFCRLPGKTLIYVTHYPNEIPPEVDKKIILERIAIEE